MQLSCPFPYRASNFLSFSEFRKFFSSQKMWEALVYGLTKTLGKKRMNRETRRTWFLVFRFLANRIIEGMREFRLKVDKD